MSGRLISWDSCIFLAWFNKEEDKPLGAIEQSLRLLDDEKINLLVSAISYAEVLDKAGSKAGTDFRGFVKRPNVIVANIDARVADLAGAIRTGCLDLHREGKIRQGLKIPDACIAATAILYKASELQTFDPILRDLSGLPVVQGLQIREPARTQLGF